MNSIKDTYTFKGEDGSTNTYYYKAFCEEIVACLVKYGGKSEQEARTLVEGSHLIKNPPENDTQAALIFHEVSYYWAMDLIYQAPNWWKAHPESWPPPDDFYEWSEKFLESKNLDDYIKEG